MVIHTSDANLVAALSLTNANLHVFPARAIHNATTGRWNKPPCIKEWQTSASADPDDVARWWQQFPDAIPAISCTVIIVIDADRHHGGSDGVLALFSLVALEQDWPQHPIVLTPSGGEHHYFRQSTRPLGNGTGLLPSGIDVRGNGGYIIGPGAVLPDGTCYRSVGSMELTDAFANDSIPALPTWLEKIVRADRVVPTNSTSFSGSSVTNRERRFAETALEGAAREAQTAPRGKRNSVLNSVAFRLGRMIGAGWIAKNIVAARLLSAASDLKREDGETAVKATINSGVTAGSRKPHPGLSDRKWGEK
jgi:hypothetical protein